MPRPADHADKPSRGTARNARARPAAAAHPEAFDLAWHLPHLLRRAHFAAEAQFSELYGSEATSRQLALLVAVAQSPGASQNELAAMIGLDANTCSDLVRRTCQRGWLVRRRSDIDRRAFRLELTDSGRALIRDRALPLAGPYAERVAAALTESERTQLVLLLRKLLGLHR
jgi:DNA-binding MarR family transcriptional regulator